MSAAEIEVRPIEPGDDAAVAELIRAVMPEFGAVGDGYAINDPEVDAMSSAYSLRGARYWVVVRDGVVRGGGGYAALAGGESDTCELKKMYFYADVRGRGLGARILDLSIEHARLDGYERMYLETLEHMTDARRLYERRGFEPLSKPLGATGHFGCNAWYAKRLTIATMPGY
jgi:putative acetyltransferase